MHTLRGNLTNVKIFNYINKRPSIADYMGQVMNMTISLDELGLTNPDRAGELAERCAFTKSMTIRISTDILWTSDNAADRAFDWLAVLMFGEFLASLGTAPTFRIIRSMDQVMAVDFTLTTGITDTCLTAIMKYGAALLAFQTEGTATCHFKPDEIMDYEQALLTFQEDIASRVHAFDELAGLYSAEYLSGLAEPTAFDIHHVEQLAKWLPVERQQRATA